MASKNRQGPTQTTTQTADPASQAYINQQRNMAQGAAQTAMAGPAGGGSWFTGPLTGQQIQGAMNPYIQNVVDATRGEFDHLRAQGQMQTQQGATQAGAYGGSRHGVAEGIRMGEMDRAQGSQIAQLMHQGYGQATQLADHNRQLEERQLQDPLFRAQTGLGFSNLGMGPVGSSSTATSTNPRNWMGGAMGGAQAGAAFGPWGAAAGGVLGGLFGG